jgi:hypothetical protein
MSVFPSSPLDTLERAFQLLVVGPEPLALDGAQVEGLPSRMIALDELRSMLLHPSTSFATRDAAMGLVVRCAQAGCAQWRVGLAGVLLPGLRRMAGRVVRDYPGDAADVDAEILVGLLEALDGFDPGRGHVAARLVWAAYRRGARLRSAELAESDRRAVLAELRLPGRAWGHPDVVLARAVTAGVVSAEEAELIGETRIGGVYLPTLAAGMGVAADTLRHRRRRAELRLVAWLSESH